MPLTDTHIKAAKPREKDWKLADEKGLYLLDFKAGQPPGAVASEELFSRSAP